MSQLIEAKHFKSQSSLELGKKQWKIIISVPTEIHKRNSRRNIRSDVKNLKDYSLTKRSKTNPTHNVEPRTSFTQRKWALTIVFFILFWSWQNLNIPKQEITIMVLDSLQQFKLALIQWSIFKLSQKSKFHVHSPTV